MIGLLNMSEAEKSESLPSGQIFFGNKWTRAAAAVLGLSTPFLPACANQPSIVQPASASELEKGLEINSTPIPTATRRLAPLPTVTPRTPYPDYQITLPEGWVKGKGAYIGNDHIFFSTERPESSAVVGKITLGRTSSPEEEAQRIRSTLSEQVQMVKEDELNIEYLMDGVRTLLRFKKDHKGQVIIIEVLIPNGLTTVYQKEAQEFINAIH